MSSVAARLLRRHVGGCAGNGSLPAPVGDLRRRYLSQAEVEATWAGLRPGSIDTKPYIGPAPGLEAGDDRCRHGVLEWHSTRIDHVQCCSSEPAKQQLADHGPVVDVEPFRARDEAADIARLCQVRGRDEEVRV